MFVVMNMQDFEFEPSPSNRLSFPFPITVEKGKMVGYLPVYLTRGDALVDYPNSQVMEIREVKQ